MNPLWLFLIVPVTFIAGVFVGGVVLLRFARSEAKRLRHERIRQYFKEYAKEN